MRKRHRHRFIFHANSLEWKAARAAKRYAFFSQTNHEYDQAQYIDCMLSQVDLQKLLPDQKSQSAGQCHGLTVWWLQLMKKREEEMLYGLVKRIVNCPADQHETVADEMSFLFKMIFKKQNPIIYSNQRVNYKKLGMLLGGKKQVNYYGQYSKETLAQFFADRKQENNQFRLGDTGTTIKHSVGVFVRDGLFYFYDANNVQGVAERFKETKPLAEAVFKALDLEATPFMEVEMVYGDPYQAKLVPPPPALPSWWSGIYHFFWRPAVSPSPSSPALAQPISEL